MGEEKELEEMRMININTINARRLARKATWIADRLADQESSGKAVEYINAKMQGEEPGPRQSELQKEKTFSDYHSKRYQYDFLVNLFTARNDMTPNEAIEQILFESMTDDEQWAYIVMQGYPDTRLAQNSI